MTSSMSRTDQDGENVDVKESTEVTTIHRIYRDDNEDLVFRDPNNRRSFINRPAYAKLHRSFSSGNKRHSVDSLKGRFENLARQRSKEQDQSDDKRESASEPKKETNAESTPADEEEPEVFTPASFGYPKTAKLVPPLIKPKPAIRRRPPKDENSNVVNRGSQISDLEEVNIVLQPSASQESVDRIAKELSGFTMEGKPKDRKRGSFRKLFLGGLFGKDKKKKEEKRVGDSIVYDNMKNETNFNRQSPIRQTVFNQRTGEDLYDRTPSQRELNMQEYHERKVKELEQEYAQLHVNHFNSIRRSYEERNDNYVIMDNSKTKPMADSVVKFIDTSSSTSTESEKEKRNHVLVRDTPPRAQETYQNITMAKPKAAIATNSERLLANPFKSETESPKTIERNLNKSNSKDYPDKPTFNQEETYGTACDNITPPEVVKVVNSRPPMSPPKSVALEITTLESLPNRDGISRTEDAKPVNSRPAPSSPKSLSLESTKLKLPPNREIYDPQPRVKSPIPSSKVSTEKIIATELLKNTRSPTPPKRTISRPEELLVATKPPMSPKFPKKQEPQGDKIVTNAMVHVPQRSQTIIDNRMYGNVAPNPRASTPVDLRMSVSMKMSPKKEDVRKSVEEYYWKQLKKLKEEEDSRLHLYQMNDYYEDQAKLKRSRSLSPSSHRGGRRSLSLPRDNRGQNYVEYGRLPPQQPIPEDQAIITTDGPRHFVYDQNFVRNSPDRRSVDSLQRPIFRRGSLTKQEVYDSNPYNKRVSFSNSHSTQQAWPTRNGYTQSPPQRRLERVESDMDDEVFIQPEPIYGYSNYVSKEPLYSNRVLQQFRAQQYQQQPLYGPMPSQMGSRRLSVDSLPRQQEVYNSRPPPIRRPLSNVPQFDQRYSSSSQLSLQRNPVYSSRQSMTDANYGQKQVTVRNKYCDIYGQIHDSPQMGVVMGQVQRPPVPPPRQPDAFVRGSRLTASASDIGRRNNNNNTRYLYDTNYENRPLPPPPRHARNAQISDTESGSDVSEIQRIMQNKTKKRGFFGK